MDTSSAVAESPAQPLDVNSHGHQLLPQSPKVAGSEVSESVKESDQDVAKISSVGDVLVADENEEEKSKKEDTTGQQESSFAVDDSSSEKEDNEEITRKKGSTDQREPSSGGGDTSSEEEEDEKTTKRETKGQRERKKVQRLSESLNKSFELSVAKRDKQGDPIKPLLQGHGTPLGDIPLIEASIRKTKPADLKILHYAAFGRLGSVAEVRTNLRRFCGFTFTKSSPEYLKHEEMCNRKSVADIRNALRQLNLEVSGSRSQIVTRLLEFLLSPSADLVKYHGKLHKRSHRVKKSKSKQKEDGTKRRTSTSKSSAKDLSPAEKIDTSSRKRKSAMNDSSGGSGGDNDDTSLSENSEEEETVKSSDGDSIYSPGAKKSKKTSRSPKGKKKTVSRSPLPKKAKLKASPKNVAPKKSKKAMGEATMTDTEKRRRLHVSDESGDDDELPLASMIDIPSEETLKSSVFEVLATADLKKDTMKVIRSAISAKFGGIDLSSKKDFIKNTIKEYLSHHYKPDSPSKDAD